MLTELEHDTRCESHIGEAFRVRCTQCDDLAAEARILAQLHPHSLLECHLHPGYYFYPAQSCDRCAREANGASRG